MTDKPPAPQLVRRTPSSIALFAVATLSLTALDVWSKHWAQDNLSRPRRGDAPPVCEPGEDGWSDYQRLRGDTVPLIDDILELEYAENCGAAFSLLHAAPHSLRRGLFSLAALAASIALTVMFVQGRGRTWFVVGAPMVVSGALGNLIDRVTTGYVIDFIHFHWHDAFDYPVFNVADIGVVVGVILLLIDGAREPAPEKSPDKKSAEKAPEAARAEAKPDEDDEDEDEGDAEPKSEGEKASG